MILRKLIVLGALAVSLALGGPAAAQTTAPSGGANNVVIVQTTDDGTQRARAHVQIAQAGGPNVTSANIATATASDCTACLSSAVAVQVLLVTSSPDYFAPGNVAAAANGSCTSCGTFAYAWQYVLQVDGPAHLSPEGRAQAATIEQEIDDATASIPPATLADDLALQARLDELTAQLKTVVDDEVQQGNVKPAGPPEIHAHTEYQPS